MPVAQSPTLSFLLERMPTPIGTMLIVVDQQERLRALGWEDYPARLLDDLRLRFGAGVVLEDAPPVSRARRALDSYFAGDLSAIDGLSVEAGGTPFQRDVWSALRRIPAGQTLSYGALAAQIGRPKAVRAVGLANGANPIGIVVPCHRVIGSNGALTGYGGGLERKRWLLAHEGVRGAWTHELVESESSPRLFR